MLTKTSSWQKLSSLAKQPEVRDLKSLFKDQTRTERLSFDFGQLHLDLSKNWINDEILMLLKQLAQEMQLTTKIDDLFLQNIVNVTEQKAASHTLIREYEGTSSRLNNEHKTMFAFANKIAKGDWLTAFNQPVQHLVNIGIGGSYLGPRLVTESLTNLQSDAAIPVEFAASVDDSLIEQLFQSIDVKHTLFCISSKSFGTVETLNNAKAIQARLEQLAGYKPKSTNSSLMAITANTDKAISLGIPQSHILQFSENIGGRFSLWSSIGFPIVLSAGEDAFKKLLAGAHAMDQHFRHTPFEKNLPVLMALLSVWYRNFMGLSAYTALPYDARLRCFPTWLQQLMMESTGKMHNVVGEQLNYATSPWVFGDHGQLSQHAFFQAFHQGNDILPIDFIGVKNTQSESQQFLLVNMIAQSAALMNGNDTEHPLKRCVGNRPSTTLLLQDLSPETLGQLLALYEHMIYTQSVLWDVNCFDQPGVELGKDIARSIEQHLLDDSLNSLQLDPSTQSLLQRIITDE